MEALEYIHLIGITHELWFLYLQYHKAYLNANWKFLQL